MRGTQWSQDESLKGKFFIFDCWEYLNQLLDLTYRNRLRIVATLPLDQSHARVAIYPLDARDWFWNNFVENGRFEGIVYRSSVETKLQCEIIREKRVLTLEGRVVGFQPGKIGKYGHTLGALEIEIIPSGVKTTISGMTDAERDEIWTHKPEYLGRVCEFEASAIFKSGSVRHPRFVRWRTDR
jgi:ATP-dependent DNA ligase